MTDQTMPIGFTRVSTGHATSRPETHPMMDDFYGIINQLLKPLAGDLPLRARVDGRGPSVQEKAPAATRSRKEPEDRDVQPRSSVDAHGAAERSDAHPDRERQEDVEEGLSAPGDHERTEPSAGHEPVRAEQSTRDDALKKQHARETAGQDAAQQSMDGMARMAVSQLQSAILAMSRDLGVAEITPQKLQGLSQDRLLEIYRLLSAFASAGGARPAVNTDPGAELDAADVSGRSKGDTAGGTAGQDGRMATSIADLAQEHGEGRNIPSVDFEGATEAGLIRRDAVQAIRGDVQPQPPGQTLPQGNHQGARQALDTLGLSSHDGHDGARMMITDRASRVAVDFQSRQTEMMDRIVRVTKLAIKQGGGDVQLRLHPPKLGFLRIDLSVRDGVLHANLHAENATAKHMLTQHLEELKASLQQQGIDVGALDVSVGKEADQSPLAQEDAGRRNPSAVIMREEEHGREAGVRTPLVMSLVDYVI